MADEGKRRRGRKRGRSQRPPHGGRPEETSEEQPEQPEEGDEEPEVEASEPEDASGRSFGLPFGRKKDDDEEAPEVSEREKKKERERVRAGAVEASPMDFWRRGQARPVREAADRQRSMSLWKRVTGLYFPPWVPVVAIIFVVFGILGALFFARSATGAPRNGDHWHATYEYIVCGNKQPNFPTWSGGVHTHADGYIHIHPNSTTEEGAGARLVRWFEYGGGELSGDTVRAPGSRDEYKNGDECPNGEEGFVQVFVNGQKLDDFDKYIPQDTDNVQIIFGPEREEEIETGNVIPESQATRDVELELSDSGNPQFDATISPTSLEMETGEAVKLVLKNTGSTSLGLRVSGADQEFNTDDDFVNEGIEAGGEGVLVVRFNEPGEYGFRLSNFADRGLGTITVTGDPVQAVSMTITDDGPFTATFDPDTISVIAGTPVKLVIENNGEATHGINLPGPDGIQQTEDDITSGIIDPGAIGELTFLPDEVGEITFVDVQDVSGTIVVREEGDEPDGSATPTPAGQEQVDVELEVDITKEGFEPADLTVGAGEKFRINVTAGDEFIHNLRIAGPDGEYQTPDDLKTDGDPIDGETSPLVGQIDEPGMYEFRDDFNPQLTGTLVVE